MRPSQRDTEKVFFQTDPRKHCIGTMKDSSERLRVFAYLDAEKAAIYRPIMRTFLRAKEMFGIHLRPAEVREALGAEMELDEAGSALEQLCEWGNLEKHADTADVATVEDFYRPRYLFQLTREGEAAERALEKYYEVVERPGELQTAALADIRLLLGELEQLVAIPDPDAGKVFMTLKALRSRFDELTANALAFIGSLQRNVDLLSAGVDEFLAYKERLIGYIERFVGELVLATAEIAACIERIEGSGIERLLEIAGQREIVDVLEQSESGRQAAVDAWTSRWAGLRSWFKGAAGAPSQSEILRGRARSSIRSLLAAATAINDRRMSRSDRVADFRALARWFAEAETDAEAHRLWRAAFGLAPARHLKTDDATLDMLNSFPVSAQTSWLEAPPILISPRLRATGRHHRPGAPKSIVDFSAQKELLAREADEEAAQILAAQRRFATGKPMRLSEIGRLDAAEFHLFLDLLGEALAGRVDTDEPVEATSSDGTMLISLLPTLDSLTAVIETSSGAFSGPDHIILVGHQ